MYCLVYLGLRSRRNKTNWKQLDYCTFVMAALWNRADHYIFILWFLLLLFSSPNFSSRRLDVCRTSTHSVALVRIYIAGLKYTACGSLEMQDAENRRLGTIAQFCVMVHNPQLRHVSTVGKNSLSNNISSTCPHNMVNFGLLAAEIVSLVLGIS